MSDQTPAQGPEAGRRRSRAAVSALTVVGFVVVLLAGSWTSGPPGPRPWS